MSNKEILNLLDEKLEEIMLKKEAVASKILMELKRDIQVIQGDLRKIEYKIDGAIINLQNEIEKHKIISENNFGNTIKRLSFVEKMIFGTAGTILLAVLSALIATVLV